MADERGAGLGRHRPADVVEHFQALLGREQRLLAGVDADRDNQPVAQGNGMPDHVQMAVGDGVEGTWIEGNARHGFLLPRPALPGKPGGFPAGFSVNPDLFARSCRKPPNCFVLEAATKQTRARTKPFPVSAKTSGNWPWLLIHPTNDGPHNWASRPHHRGPSMIKALSAITIAACVAAALTLLPGFAPTVEASVPHVLAKSDRQQIIVLQRPAHARSASADARPPAAMADASCPSDARAAS